MNEYYTDTAYAECKRLNPDEEELCSKYNFTSNGGKSIKKSKKSKKSKNKRKHKKTHKNKHKE